MYLENPNRVALAFGIAVAATGAAFGIGRLLSHHDASTPHEWSPVPSPAPGPAPTPPTPSEPAQAGGFGGHGGLMTNVDDVVDFYLDAYDHDRSGTIEVSPFQSPGTRDERVTGGVGDMHTMVEFFRDADADGDGTLTRGELRDAVAAHDTSGTTGFNPDAPELGDGYLGARELASFRADAIEAHGAPAGYGDDRGVPQIVTDADGTRHNNEPFFRALPEYRPLT
jgi:hypothetical protein